MSNIGLCEALGNRIRIIDHVKDWVEAVLLSGKLLTNTGIVKDSYIEAMVKVTRELGPYAVIAPGVAIPHARPEDGVLNIGVSLLVVRNGVKFDSPNDPVYVVIGFAAVDKTSHLNVLKELAEFLSVGDIVEKLRNASSEEELLNILKEHCVSRQR